MKYVRDFIIVAGVVFAYIFMGAFQPGTDALISAANSSISWTGMESAQNAMNSFPLYSWFIPGLVGFIAIVVNHKASDDSGGGP